MREHVCPDCKNVFLQPFRCTTCGAQKLYDATLRLAEQRAERAEADLAAARALLQEARDNAYASIAEEGISQMRYEYRKELVERIDAALAGEGKP